MGIQDGGRGGGHVIDVEAFIIHRDSGHQGSLDVGGEPFGGLRSVLGIGDQEGLAHAALGDALDQVVVDGAADAEGEEAGGVHVPVDQVIDFVLVGDIAVGDDDHAPGHVLLHWH